MIEVMRPGTPVEVDGLDADWVLDLARVEPLGAALGISTLSAMNLISAAVELKHRLPRVWALRVPLLPDPRPRLRPGPRRPLRRHRTTRPDPPTQPRPLCRRHHRAKTAKRWSYERTEDGSYAWTSPHDDQYLVNGGGTLAPDDH